MQEALLFWYQCHARTNTHTYLRRINFKIVVIELSRETLMEISPGCCWNCLIASQNRAVSIAAPSKSYLMNPFINSRRSMIDEEVFHPCLSTFFRLVSSFLGLSLFCLFSFSFSVCVRSSVSVCLFVSSVSLWLLSVPGRCHFLSLPLSFPQVMRVLEPREPASIKNFNSVRYIIKWRNFRTQL